MLDGYLQPTFHDVTHVKELSSLVRYQKKFRIYDEPDVHEWNVNEALPFLFSIHLETLPPSPIADLVDDSTLKLWLYVS